MADPANMLSARTFGDRLMMLLRHLPMTVEELERATGIPASTLYKYLRGDSVPPNGRLVLIARATGVTPNDLLAFDSTSRGTPPYLSSPLAA